MRQCCLAALPAAILMSMPASAKENTEDPAQPAIYRQLLDCTSVKDPTLRLTCYDRQTAALEQATRNREIVISDKNAINAARRGLFGFSASIGKLMGFGGDGEQEQIKEIESKVAVARRVDNGWRLNLEDGSTWEQNDTRDFVLSPKIGNSVKITQGVLGSYFVSVQGQRAIKMRRIN